MGSIAGAAVWVIAAIFGGGVMGVWWAQMICWFIGVPVDPFGTVLAGIVGAECCGVTVMTVLPPMG